MLRAKLGECCGLMVGSIDTRTMVLVTGNSGGFQIKTIYFIRLSTDGFSFLSITRFDVSLSVLRRDRALSILTANLKAVSRSDFLSHPHKRVNIMMASKRFTIVPLELFEEEQAELYFTTIIETGK